MSSGTKVYKYRCNTCTRDVELVTDNRRPDPLRCIITDQCRGFLEPHGARRGDRARLTTPQADLADRTPRGANSQVIAAPPDPMLVALTTFSGTNGLTIAAPRRTIVGGSAVYSVKDTADSIFELEQRAAGTYYPTNSKIDILVYELTAAVLSSQKYTFTFNSIAQLLEGVDNSKEQRLLRYGATDNIKIIVNGVELDQTAYDRTVANTIRLIPGIVASELTIEVYVYKDRAQLINAKKLLRLPCIPLSEIDTDQLALRSGCSWGDVSRVVTPDGHDRSLLFCSDLSALEKRKTYSVAYFEATSSAGGTRRVDPSEIWLLLSDAPHSFVDKRLDELIAGPALLNQQFSFTYALSEATGDLVPVTDASALTLLTERLAPRAEANVTPLSLLGAERAYTKRAEAFIIGPA